MVSGRKDQLRELCSLFLKAQKILLIKEKIDLEYFRHYKSTLLDLENHRISVTEINSCCIRDIINL
jgi:hypothetical protein